VPIPDSIPSTTSVASLFPAVTETIQPLQRSSTAPAGTIGLPYTDLASDRSILVAVQRPLDPVYATHSQEVLTTSNTTERKSSPTPAAAHSKPLRDKSPLGLPKDTHHVSHQDKTSTYLQRAELKEKLAAAAATAAVTASKVKSPLPKGKSGVKEREKSPMQFNAAQTTTAVSEGKSTHLHEGTGLQTLPKLPVEDKDREKRRIPILPIPPPPRDTPDVPETLTVQHSLPDKLSVSNALPNSAATETVSSPRHVPPIQDMLSSASVDTSKSSQQAPSVPPQSLVSAETGPSNSFVKEPAGVTSKSVETMAETFRFGAKRSETTEEEWLKPQNSSVVAVMPEKRKSIFAKMGDWFAGHDSSANVPSER